MLDKDKLYDSIYELYTNFPRSKSEAVDKWYDCFYDYLKDAHIVEIITDSFLYFIENGAHEGAFKSKMSSAINAINSTSFCTNFDLAIVDSILVTEFTSISVPMPPPLIKVDITPQNSSMILVLLVIFNALRSQIASKTYLNREAAAEFFSDLIHDYVTSVTVPILYEYYSTVIPTYTAITTPALIQ